MPISKGFPKTPSLTMFLAMAVVSKPAPRPYPTGWSNWMKPIKKAATKRIHAASRPDAASGENGSEHPFEDAFTGDLLTALSERASALPRLAVVIDHTQNIRPESLNGSAHWLFRIYYPSLIISALR